MIVNPNILVTDVFGASFFDLQCITTSIGFTQTLLKKKQIVVRFLFKNTENNIHILYTGTKLVEVDIYK